MVWATIDIVLEHKVLNLKRLANKREPKARNDVMVKANPEGIKTLPQESRGISCQMMDMGGILI